MEDAALLCRCCWSFLILKSDRFLPPTLDFFFQWHMLKMGDHDDKKWHMREHREVVHHSFSYSQIQTLCSTKSSRKTLQNLPYKVHYSIFHYMLLYFFPNKSSSLCRHRLRKKSGTYRKREEATLDFCGYRIWQIFKCYCWNISLSTNSEIGKSASSSSFAALMLLFLMHKCLAG